MLLTEEEAKEKLCPHLSSNAFFDVSDNYTRTRENRLVRRKCWASKCMGWRWFDSLPVKDGIQNRRGFCGLAGRVTE